MGLQLSPMQAELMLLWDTQSSWALTAWRLGGWHHLLQSTQVLGQSLAWSKGHWRESAVFGELYAKCHLSSSCLLLTLRRFHHGSQSPSWQITSVLPAARDTCTSSCHRWKSTDTWTLPQMSSESTLVHSAKATRGM